MRRSPRATGGVASFNTRTGAVTLALADVTDVGGAPIASPAFSGLPAAPTPTPADNSTGLATTAVGHRRARGAAGAGDLVHGPYRRYHLAGRRQFARPVARC